MTHVEKIKGYIAIAVVGGIGFFWCLVAYVAVHFILKFW